MLLPNNNYSLNKLSLTNYIRIFIKMSENASIDLKEKQSDYFFDFEKLDNISGISFTLLVYCSLFTVVFIIFTSLMALTSGTLIKTSGIFATWSCVIVVLLIIMLIPKHPISQLIIILSIGGIGVDIYYGSKIINY